MDGKDRTIRRWDADNNFSLHDPERLQGILNKISIGVEMKRSPSEPQKGKTPTFEAYHNIETDAIFVFPIGWNNWAFIGGILWLLRKDMLPSYIISAIFLALAGLVSSNNRDITQALTYLVIFHGYIAITANHKILKNFLNANAEHLSSKQIIHIGAMWSKHKADAIQEARDSIDLKKNFFKLLAEQDETTRTQALHTLKHANLLNDEIITFATQTSNIDSSPHLAENRDNSSSASPPRSRRATAITDLAGMGDYHCLVCAQSGELVSFIHGIDESESGFQCQSCGKIHRIKNNCGSEIPNGCSCGGLLSKDKPLFCPTCKSDNVEYHLRYLT